MSEIFCPNCGKTHSTNKKNCASCGEDLEDIILDFKNKHLPITFNNGKKKEAQPTDEWEKQRQTILKIKEQEKARERIERLEEQQQISKSEKTTRRLYLLDIKVLNNAKKKNRSTAMIST